MVRHAREFAVAVGLVCLLASPAYAGMPTVRWSDLALLRVETISFFAAGFLVSALVVKWSWNRLAIDFSSLPRLSYGRACLLVGLWSAAFVLVLTMISGARELMTPGAWESAGSTYRLASERSVDELSALKSENHRSALIHLLGRSLEAHAIEHANVFPISFHEAGIPDAAASPPELFGLSYVYLAEMRERRMGMPVVYEPSATGSSCLVYLAGGIVTRMPLDEIHSLVEAHERP